MHDNVPILVCIFIVFISYLGSWGLGEATLDADQPDSVALTFSRVKKRTKKLTQPHPKNAWGKLLSQCTQVGFASSSYVRDRGFHLGISIIIRLMRMLKMINIVLLSLHCLFGK